MDQDYNQNLNGKARFLTSNTAWLSLVFGMGLFIRWIALFNIQIINPDGVLYIYQAKAISNGQWNLLNDCVLSYITLYPFFIALFQKAVSQWVLSAQLVSFFFGFAMLIPLYLLLRHFFNQTISRLTTLLFAFIPVFVRYSVDAMRDPTYWFFFTAAIWVISCHTRQTSGIYKTIALLAFGSCLILLAALTRIEAMVLYPATCLFIFLARGDRKAIRLMAFLAPLILSGGVGVLVSMYAGIDFMALVRLDAIAHKAVEPLTAYQQLRDSLASLSDMHDHSLLGEFLMNARRTIWLIVLGTILNNTMEAVFYPYLPFFLLGIGAAWKISVRREPIIYLIIILMLSFLLLYTHTMQKWIMTYRFVVLLIIPSAVLAGLGIQKIIDWLMNTLKMHEARAVVIMAVFIVVVGVIKNGRTIEGDKALYPRIGSEISRLEGENHPIGVAAKPSTLHQWVTFYANAQLSVPVCHRSYEIKSKSLANLKAWMRSSGIVYFLWEESRWNNSPFGRQPADFLNDFESLGQFYHPDPGNLVLFRLKDEK